MATDLRPVKLLTVYGQLRALMVAQLAIEIANDNRLATSNYTNTVMIRNKASGGLVYQSEIPCKDINPANNTIPQGAIAYATIAYRNVASRVYRYLNVRAWSAAGVAYWLLQKQAVPPSLDSVTMHQTIDLHSVLPPSTLDSLKFSYDLTDTNIGIDTLMRAYRWLKLDSMSIVQGGLCRRKSSKKNVRRKGKVCYDTKYVVIRPLPLISICSRFSKANFVEWPLSLRTTSSLT
ncbi:hypothetical protein BH10BAC6_BH10BAC6_12190 [soil metagenome]